MIKDTVDRGEMIKNIRKHTDRENYRRARSKWPTYMGVSLSRNIYAQYIF